MIFGGFLKTDLVNYPSLVSATVFTTGCNLRCPYCHNAGLAVGEASERYGEEDVIQYLEQRRGMLDGLVVSGGEPTIHKDLPAFISKVKSLGLKVKLDTNGTNPQMLGNLIDEGLLDYVAMDLKTGLLNYGKVGCRDTNPIIGSMELLRRSTVAHEFRTTCPKAIVSHEDLLEISSLVNGSRWYLQIFNDTQTLNDLCNEEGGWTREELGAFIEENRLGNTFVR